MWEAETSEGRLVALKRLDRAMTEDLAGREVEARFREEYRTLAALSHPNIVAVDDFGVDDDGAYYTMELLDGADLAAESPLAPEVVALVLHDVASALSFLHARGLLHRDVAPSNVRESRDGRFKLMDFGVLSRVGFSDRVVGTPPCMPPESLRAGPLDARADLYSLGALGYYLATGRHAHDVRDARALERSLANAIKPPSQLREGIPRPLEDLLLALLRVDPLARPASAGEVLDRLAPLVNGGERAAPGLAHAYLESAPLIGRDRERAAIRAMIRSASEGDVAAGGAPCVVVSAESGMGKSRLLDDAVVEAKLAGMTVLEARGEGAGRGPFAVMRALADAMLARVDPDEVSTAIGGNDRVALGRAIPRLGAAVATTKARSARPSKSTRPPIDPAGDRVMTQHAVARLFRAIARHTPLLLVVDDLQRCDEASAAVLASLVERDEGAMEARARLAVLAAIREDDLVDARVATTTRIEAHATRLRLLPLELPDVELLLTHLFGPSDRNAMLAAHLCAELKPSPLAVLEVLRGWLAEGTIRFEAGTWLLPRNPPPRALPASLAAALDARIARLSPDALAIGRALCLHPGAIPLRRCTALRGEREPAHDRSTRDRTGTRVPGLDELEREELIAIEGAPDRLVRFRHDSVREALIRSLERDDPQKLGERRPGGGAIEVVALRTARALQADGETEREADVGWLLLRAGERAEAAQLLTIAGKRLFDAQSYGDALPMLEAALAVIEGEGASLEQRLDLRHVIITAGQLSDRDVLLRYAEGTISALRHVAGLDVAERLGPRIGRRAALVLGAFVAIGRRVFASRATRGPSVRVALSRFFVTVCYAVAAHGVALDVDGAERYLRMLEPFAISTKRFLYAAYLMAKNFTLMPVGRWREVALNAERAMEIAQRDRLTPIAEADRENGIGSAKYMKAACAIFDQDEGADALVDELAATEKLHFVVLGLMLGVVRARFRGEEDEARRLDAELQRRLLDMGGKWSIDSQRAWTAGLAYGLTGDLEGLKRSHDELSRLVARGHHLAFFVELAAGEHLRERGEHAAARTRLERALELAGVNPMQRQFALVALGETWLALADHESGDALRSAREAADRALEIAQGEHGRFVWRIRAERLLALCVAREGDVAGAAVMIDRALAEVRPLDNPLLLGLLHEARARIAAIAGDPAEQRLQAAAARALFARTRNPALIRRLEAEQVRRAERRSDLPEEMTSPKTTWAPPRG